MTTIGRTRVGLDLAVPIPRDAEGNALEYILGVVMGGNGEAIYAFQSGENDAPAQIQPLGGEGQALKTCTQTVGPPLLIHGLATSVGQRYMLGMCPPCPIACAPLIRTRYAKRYVSGCAKKHPTNLKH